MWSARVHAVISAAYYIAAMTASALLVSGRAIQVVVVLLLFAVGSIHHVGASVLRSRVGAA